MKAILTASVVSQLKHIQLLIKYLNPVQFLLTLLFRILFRWFIFSGENTLYSETAATDALREPGFSKDGKTEESQIVLDLLVSEGGYPLSYSLFNGKQHEGYLFVFRLIIKHILGRQI